MQEANEVTGLKNQSVTLSCSDGNISVWLASYAGPNDNPSTECWFPVADILREDCNDKKTCSFPVNKAASAGNDCPGVNMQLYVMYGCD